MLIRLAKMMAGSLWFFCCMLLGVKLFFPAQAAADRASFEVDRMTNGGISLVLGDVKAWTLSGLSLDDLQVLRHKKSRRKDADGAAPSVLAEVDSLQVRLSLLPLMGGAQLIGLGADLYGGSLAGQVGRDGKETILDLVLDGLQLNQYPAQLPDGEELQLVGSLDLESDLRIDSEDLEGSSGAIRIEIDEFGILNEAFADSFSESVIELEADEGKLVVSKGRFDGDKIQADINGEITLKERLGRSKVDIKIRVKMDTSYELLANAAGYKRARDSEGFYHFKCTGTLQNRRCRKDTAAARGGSGSRRGGARSSGGADRERSTGSMGDRFSPDESAEERRERRQERIRERRRKARDRRGGGAADRERSRPDPDRSRRDRDDRRDDNDDDFDMEDELFEDEPAYDDDAPLPDLQDADMNDYDDDLVEELGDEPYIGD